MPEVNLIVARYRDGRIVKGSTTDFFPERPQFHVQVPGQAGTQAIKVSDLKAVFFVKSLAGNRMHMGPREFTAPDPVGHSKGKRIAVAFSDGEILIGHALNYTKGRQGFFVTPFDGDDNNLRVYVLTASTTSVKLGPEAEQLARTAPRLRFKPPKAA